MPGLETLIAPSCDQIEAQLAMLRSLPGANQWRPTVSAVIIFPTTEEVLLCASVDCKKPGPNDLKFPQGGIEAGESAVDAFLREIAEETGIPTDAYVSIHGLAGDALKGCMVGSGKDRRRKMLLPMVGVVGERHDLKPNKELSLLDWYLVGRANEIIGKQRKSKRSQNTRDILARFSLLAEEIGLLHPVTDV